jgi:hypothetical protein
MLNATKAVMTILAVAIGTATIGAARAVNPSARSENESPNQDPPTALPIDPIQNVGHSMNHEVKSFVYGQLALHQFEDEHDFPVDKEGGGLCILSVRAAKNSQYIPRKNDHKPNGYVVALIRNPYDCKPKGFSLAKDDSAAWVVRFDSQKEYSDRRIVGTAYVVTLTGPEDQFLGSWSFWQCGSKHHGPPNTASAVVQNEAQPGDICNTAKPDHNATRISKERMAAYQAQISGVRPRRGRQLLEPGDAAVWFACGTDCCYSEGRS